MTTYFVANYRITDAEGMAKYREAVVPRLLKAGCEFLVINDKVEVVEGSPAPTVIVLKFESDEAAKKWWNSPEYQAINHLRLNGINRWVGGLIRRLPDAGISVGLFCLSPPDGRFFQM